RKVLFSFKGIAAVAENPVIEPFAVRDQRFEGAAIPYGPSGRVIFMNPTPGITASVRRIIPCAIVHDGPCHELLPWIVRIAVVVEEIGVAESPDADAIPPCRPRSGELVFVTRCVFAILAETEIVRDVAASQIRLRRCRKDAWH